MNQRLSKTTTCKHLQFTAGKRAREQWVGSGALVGHGWEGGLTNSWREMITRKKRGEGGAHVEMTQVIIIIHNYNLLNPDRVSLTGNRRECFQTHFPKVRRFLLENSNFGLKSGFFKTLYFETD